MPIDWSQLQPLYHPAQMQALPVINNTPSNSLATGIMQGLQQGQQMQGTALDNRMKAIQLAQMQQQQATQQQLAQIGAQVVVQQQAMQQQAQQGQIQQPSGIAPGQSGPLDPNQAQQMPSQGNPIAQVAPQQPQATSQQDPSQQGLSPSAPQAQMAPGQLAQPMAQQQMQDPGKGYMNQVVQVFQKMGRPDLAMSALQGYQSLTEATVKNQAAMQDMNQKQLQNNIQNMASAGKIAFALTGMPDSQAVQLYNQQYGKMMQNIDPKAPAPGSDPQQTLAYLHGAAGAAIEVSQQISTNPYLSANLAPTQAAKDQQTRQLSEMVGLNSPYTKELAKTDGEIAKQANDNRTTMANIGTDAANTLSSLKDISSSQLGPMIDKTKLNDLDPKVQAFKSQLDIMAAHAKELYNIKSNRMGKDQLDFLQGIAGSTAISKQALTNVLTNTLQTSNRVAQANWDAENTVRQRASGYQQWLSANPRPQPISVGSGTSQSSVKQTSINPTQPTKMWKYNPSSGKLE